MMQRVQSQMRRQTTALLQQARAMQAAASSNRQQLVSLRAPGGDAQSFSFVSTLSGSGVCARSVQITSNGDGKPAKVVSKTYGDCSAGGRVPGAASTSEPTQPPRQANAMPVKTAPRAASYGQPGRVGI
jgi:hypothetical protein